MKLSSTIISSLVASVAVCATTQAAIIGTAGQALLIGNPPSALYGALPGPPAYCWDEQTAMQVGALQVNTIGNGNFTGPVNYFGMVGGVFDSHIIHFDASTGVANVNGTVWFSSAIRAVIYQNVLLDNTDFQWGAPGTTYPTGDPFRSYGPALWQSQYQVMGNQLHFNLWVGGAAFPNRMSELRVFTDAVPAPGALGLLGFAGLVARRRRR